MLLERYNLQEMRFMTTGEIKMSNDNQVNIYIPNKPKRNTEKPNVILYMQY